MSSQTINKAEPANLLAHRNGWHWVRLGDHVSKIGSGLTPLGGHASYQASGIPLIRSQNVHMNRFEPDGLAFISTEQDEAMSVSRVQPGDVLLNITGASIGRVCVAPSERCPANVNQHVCVIRGDGSLDSEFVAFFLASPEFQSFIWETQAGATRQALTKALIEDFRIPFTSLEEQRRIAGRLREQLAEVAKARTAVQAQLAAAQALPAASLRNVFDSPSAHDWPTKVIDELAETCSGATPPRGNTSYFNGSIPWIKTGELKDGEVMAAEEHVSEMALRETSLRLLPAKTLLVAMYGQGQTRGRTGLLSIPATTNQACFAILPNEKFIPEFLQMWFRFSYARLRQETESRGGNQPNLNGVLLRRLRVPIPEKSLQESITARLAAELAEVTRLRESLSGKLETLDRLPAALLAQAFHGGR